LVGPLAGLTAGKVWFREGMTRRLRIARSSAPPTCVRCGQTSHHSVVRSAISRRGNPRRAGASQALVADPLRLLQKA